jgi:hypothetical protein
VTEQKKQPKCRYCGTGLSQFEARHGRVCGSDECNKEDAEAERDRDEMAREAAEQDGYSRYGGSGW